MAAQCQLCHLWRWQASGSIRTHRKHSEFLWCAALALWRRSQGGPLCAGQHIYQGRVNQGHLPFCGDVVTWELSANGGKGTTVFKQKSTHGSARTNSSVKFTYSSGSSAMQRVPKPGLSSNTSPKYLILASVGRSLLILGENVIHTELQLHAHIFKNILFQPN